MWRDWIFWAYLFTLVDVALASTVTVHAVLWKRESRAVIGWVGLAWLAPILGAAIYFCFGINRIERKASSLNLYGSGYREQHLEVNWGDEREQAPLAEEFPDLIGLATAGHRLTGWPVVAGNSVAMLVDGDQAFPAMLEAIGQAERSVSLLSYIFDSDRAGDAFLEALAGAHGRGVQIRVLIDDVGSRYSHPSMLGRLAEAGITTASFLPTRIPRFFKYANLRNHRKIMVVDGRIAFTGGTNIREGHWLARSPASPIQCLHFRLEGPVVTQIQHVFAMDWAFSSGESLAGEDWFSPGSTAGDVWARGIEDGPDEHFEKMSDALVAALAAARRQVRIVTPYFLPNESLIQALNVTALRGVDVEIFLPSANNIALVQWAATAILWQLLEKGVRIYSTPPPFDHSKAMTVDEKWTLIGSTNWDPRSLRLNFEFNVECYSRELARSVNAVIDRKALQAHQITLDEVNSRSFPIRLRDGLARLLTPYL